MNITEFLLARIAEDEAAAINAAASINRAKNGNGNARAGTDWTANMGMVEGQHTGDWGDSDLWDCEGAASLCVAEGVADHMARNDPARVLAESAAKRAVVAAHPITRDVVEVSTRIKWGYACETCFSYGDVVEDQGYCDTLRALAAIYADHPDYDDTWKL